jgi:hypothetical protein
MSKRESEFEELLHDAGKAGAASGGDSMSDIDFWLRRFPQRPRRLTDEEKRNRVVWHCRHMIESYEGPLRGCVGAASIVARNRAKLALLESGEERWSDRLILA